jgi:hypothetical protein
VVGATLGEGIRTVAAWNDNGLGAEMTPEAICATAYCVQVLAKLIWINAGSVAGHLGFADADGQARRYGWVLNATWTSAGRLPT